MESELRHPNCHHDNHKCTQRTKYEHGKDPSLAVITLSWWKFPKTPLDHLTTIEWYSF